jgi:GWxTD domain-containing protein
MFLAAFGAQAPSGPLSQFWYDDDEWHLEVQDIITGPELAAYQRVKTAEERDDFISRFWTRRDPTPGTAQNEFRDEFYRRVEYANATFADPSKASHNGMETDRGRFYVMFGAPTAIVHFTAGAYEIWRYDAVPDLDSDFRIQFSVPPIDSCDGSYRILSPAPIATFKGVTTSVQVYPRGFITAWIPVDFTKATSVEQMLRTTTGEAVLEADQAFFDGQLGPAGNDPLSKHLLGCRMFEPGGMGFTHPIPPGSYVFSSAVTLTNGAPQQDRVAFEVK